jgi:hypothetical protein
MPGMKRKWLWLLALAIPVIIGAGYVLVPVNESRISQVNCDKIQEGWSEKQIEDLLGSCTFHGNVLALWADSDDNRIVVSISLKNRTVTEKRFWPSEFSFYERIKRRIERRLKTVWP